MMPLVQSHYPNKLHESANHTFNGLFASIVFFQLTNWDEKDFCYEVLFSTG